MLTAGTAQATPFKGMPRLSPAPRPRAAAHRPVLLVTVVLAAVINFNLVWNQFYQDVPRLFDAGWYAHLVHRNAPLLHNPPSVAFATIGARYYSTHFSPALWLLSLPSHVLPLGPQAWLACLQAAEHVLLAVLVWLAVRRFAPDTTRLQRGAAAAVILLAPFNGVALASMLYPHFESWFAVGALGFLFALFGGHLRTAAALFFGTLLLREDMGFHLCGVLLLTAAAARIGRGRMDWQIKTWLGFAAAGFAWSCGAILLMKTFFPGDDAFARIYLGSPPFAHLNWAEVAGRLRVYAVERGHIWMPVAVYAVWGIVTRRAWMLIGYLAFVPWMLLNFTASSLAPGTLSFYYAFPLGLALLWPLVGHQVFGTGRIVSDHDARRAVWVAAALAASILGHVPEEGWKSLVRKTAFPSAELKTRLDDVAARLTAAGRHVDVAVDDAVAALAPGNFRAAQLFGQSDRRPALAALYANGRSTKIGWETARDLPMRYRVDGTALTVLSAEPLPWPNLTLLSARAGSVLPFLGAPGGPVRADGARAAEPGMRLLCAGPDGWFFRTGETWTAEVTLSPGPVAAEEETAVVCEVVTRGGKHRLARAVVTLSAADTGETRITRELPFAVPVDQDSGVEIRIQASGHAPVRVEDVVLKPRQQDRAETTFPHDNPDPP